MLFVLVWVALVDLQQLALRHVLHRLGQHVFRNRKAARECSLGKKLVNGFDIPPHQNAAVR